MSNFKRYILTLAISLGVFLASGASASLYNYYQERGLNLPSVAQRATAAKYCGISGYTGLYNQNIALEACLSNQTIGASIPTVVALYTDSLATKLTETSTSTFTLIRGTDKQSRSLSGYYGFVIDEGTTNEEFILATCSGTTCTINTRGIDIVDGETNVATLQHEHRRGAVVKITNFPQLAILSRILNGQETTPGGITFATNTIYVSSTLFGIRQNGLNLQWSIDGFTNSYNFTSSSISQLQASSTRAIGVTDSLIHVNASTTMGMAFGADGYLYQKTVSTSSIENGENGIILNTSTLVNLIATSTPATNKIPIAGTNGKLGAWGKFGGDGSDGALNITSGTTTVSAATSPYLIKNYSSLNISAGAVLQLVTSSDYGTVAIIRVLGDCTIAGTIDARGFGSMAGVGGPGGTSGNGTAGTSATTSDFDSGDGLTTHGGTLGAAGTLGGGAPAAGTGGTKSLSTFYTNSTNTLYGRSFLLTPGAAGGGGGGGASSDSTGGVGGNGGSGGGAVLLECGGVTSFTGTIKADGGAGVAGTSPSAGSASSGGGGGGGGGGGHVLFLYNSSTALTGTITVTGGAGGNGGNGRDVGASSAAQGGAGGGGGGSLISAGGNGGNGGTAGGNGSNGTAASGGGTNGTGGTGQNNEGGGGGGGGGGSAGRSLILKNIWFF